MPRTFYIPPNPDQASVVGGLQTAQTAKATRDVARADTRDAAAAGVAPTVTLPTIALTVSPSSRAENAGTPTITFTATLSAVTDSPVGVVPTWTGTATRGTDYNASATEVVIAAGQTTATFTATIVDDAVFEGDETVVLTIAAKCNGRALAGTVNAGSLTATATITENDAEPPE